MNHQGGNIRPSGTGPAAARPSDDPFELVVEEEKGERYDLLRTWGYDPVAERQRFARGVRERLVGDGMAGIEPGIAEILEIGTGRGYFCMMLAHEIPFSHVTSVDISEDQIEKARERLCRTGLQDKVTLVLADAARLHFREGFFHAAAVYVSMHHMENAGAVLENMRRAVGGDGPVAIAEYTREGLEMLAEARRKFGHGGGHGHREIPAEELENALLETFPGPGYHVERIERAIINFYFIGQTAK